nr:retrovirus-related Pol polyprotein from transposon TNT 1-94 [Tanacetum cinerariifolium]
VLWIKSQLADYDVLYDKVSIFYDNTSAISISDNPVLHSRTKHIDIKYHFIRDHILKDDIKLYFVPTDLQLADIFTKPLAEPSFTRLVAELDAIATLGLSDEKEPERTSEDLAHLSPLRLRFFSPSWKVLMTYLITSATFKPSSTSEVPLTSHMRKIDKISEEDNAEGTGDMSLFGTSVHPVSHPKAKTDKKRRTKKNTSSSEPNVSRVVETPTTQASVSQTADASEVPADTTNQSQEASKSTEEQVNQPQTADAEKVPVFK